MGSTSTSIVERVWWMAHAAPWFPSWAFFQIAAVMVGGLLVLRGGGVRFVGAYLSGVVLAMLGAIALGSGAAWLGWIGRGGTGPMPELEIAGFGALAGLAVGHIAVSRARGCSIGRSLDVLAVPIGAMIAFARLGCFFAGCDFGSPTRVPWGLGYPPMTPAFKAQVEAGLLHAEAARTLPVHPTQLYEAAIGLLVIGTVLALCARRGARPPAGERFAMAVVVYAVGRILVDVLRGDLVRGGALGLTVTQSLALALIGFALAWRINQRDARPASDVAHPDELPRDDLPSSRGSRRSSRPTASS
jgi:phosphatidylglycerol---prolipoprotein diacylglyceryl transferase